MKKLVQSIFVFSYSQVKIAAAAFLWLLFMFGFNATQAQIIITGYMANPASTDGNFEYVQLIATQAIDFATTPYAMVVSNNGTATANGWVQGAAISYKFDLTSGSVTAGQTFYVGGSGKLIAGAGSTDISSLTWIKTIAVATTSGDGFGALNTGGVMGNGGANADGIGIFSGTTLTSSSVPIDAIFYGTGVGTALSSANGYTVPSNDRYANVQGLFGQGTNTYVFADAGTGNTYVSLTGTYNAVTSAWTTPRTSTTAVLTTTSPITAINSTLTVVLPTPEINVKGNSVNIADGDASPSSTDNTDFGAVSVGSSLDKTYTIENTGAATLTVSNLTLTGTNSTEYSLVSPPTFPLAIAGNGTQTITVRFTPTVTTVRTATLNIFSDDSDEATYDFALQGGVNPTPHTIAFVRNDTTVSEGVGTTKIWVKVTSVGNLLGTVDLNATATYSNATGSGTDYTLPTTLTIPSNATLNQLFSFDIPVNDDATAESDEYVIWKFANASNLTINTSAQTTLYIRDNDKATPAAGTSVSLTLLSSFSNGTAFSGPAQINSAEISAYDSASKRVFIANSIGSKLDIVNLANPSAPALISSIDITPYGGINSVAVRNGIVAMAIENAANKQTNGKVVFLDKDGVLIDSVTVGVMPDMVAFNHAGNKVYTTNEGEPNDTYTTDPEGSISVVDIATLLTMGISTSTNVTNITFTAYNGQEATLRSQGIRIFGTGATAAQDFEPEYITISEDDTKAWVTLQENNAVAELNLTNNTITQLIPLGYKNHSLTANALDASDQSFGVNLSTFPVKGMYLPDAIASYNVGGTTYFLTANEGDARAYTGMNEETRVGSMNLDATVFPNAAELKNNNVLGRLRTTNKLGDTDNDGDFDEIYCFGARSFSVWNTSTSALVYDSGDEFERITANDATYSSFFNQNSGGVKKDRSDDKGPEAEGVTIGKVGGIPYAFIAMERTGGVLVYNVSNPAAPTYVTYSNSRPTDISPEGIQFIPAKKSPNKKDLLIVSNEISSTLSIYQVNPCTAAGIASITNATSTTICANDSVKLYNQNSNSTYTYQWSKNGVEIANAIDSIYFAKTAGIYKLTVINSNGCVDSSNVISIQTNTAPATPTAPATVCGFDAATLTATPSTGTIKWHDNNAHTGAALNFFGNSHVATTSGNYYAFALGSNGCYSQPTTTVATVRTTLPTATPTAAGTYYATDVVNDATYNHYCRCADNTILLSIDKNYAPALNFDTDGSPAADAYSVKVEVGASLTANLGTAPYNGLLGTNGWQVMNRTWDLEMGANAQEPTSPTSVISYFTDAEYLAINALLTTPLTSPSQLTLYKLKNNPYASAMSALSAGHALINDTSKIYLFNNQSVYARTWTLATPVAGFYSAAYQVDEFSGGGGGGGNGGGIPFPITLTNFSGYNDNVVNRLQWTTTSELNADKFIVERSLENKVYEAIGKVNAEGNSTSMQNYAFNDRTFAANTNYYRLKMLDKDGTFSYSKVIEITTNKFNVTIYPNPAQNELAIAGSFPANAKVSISNLLGQEVLSTNLNANSQTTVSLQNISKGIYMLNILNKENVILHSEKLVKE